MLSIGSLVVIAFTFVFARTLGADPNSTPAIVGQTAPSFDVPGLDQGRLASTALTGQIYIVNFWASWCVPCRDEAATLQSYARRSQGKVTLIGIVYNDTAAAARKFRNEFALTYPQVLDPQSHVALDYGVTGVPETYVVATDGTVKAGLIGQIGPTTLDEVVARVAAGEQVATRNGRHRSGPGG